MDSFQPLLSAQLTRSRSTLSEVSLCLFIAGNLSLGSEFQARLRSVLVRKTNFGGSQRSLVVKIILHWHLIPTHSQYVNNFIRERLSLKYQISPFPHGLHLSHHLLVRGGISVKYL